MNNFYKFLAGFSKRLSKLSGIDSVARSKQFQLLMYSPIVSWGKSLVIVGILIVGIFVKLDSFDKARVEAINNYFDYSSHFSLAAEAAKLHDYEKAEREIVLAKQLMKQGANDKVLGSDSEVKQVTNLVYPVDAVESQISLLESVVEQKPWYRDVLLHLSVLNWQLNKAEDSEIYLNEAKYLDPNNEQVKMVGELTSK